MEQITELVISIWETIPVDNKDEKMVLRLFDGFKYL